MPGQADRVAYGSNDEAQIPVTETNRLPVALKATTETELLQVLNALCDRADKILEQLSTITGLES